ncbi:MAG: hypothetical protein D6694_15125 [Gammaproteobacteria bacterium]|nr:MAG: hypothetical protein D6694_15125 [Gammaproteobacteria bacterium]
MVDRRLRAIFLSCLAGIVALMLTAAVWHQDEAVKDRPDQSCVLCILHAKTGKALVQSTPDVQVSQQVQTPYLKPILRIVSPGAIRACARSPPMA